MTEGGRGKGWDWQNNGGMDGNKVRNEEPHQSDLTESQSPTQVCRLLGSGWFM